MKSLKVGQIYELTETRGSESNTIKVVVVRLVNGGTVQYAMCEGASWYLYNATVYTISAEHFVSRWKLSSLDDTKAEVKVCAGVKVCKVCADADTKGPHKPLKTSDVVTDDYEFSHDKKPRGWGRWMFNVIDSTCGETLMEYTVPHSMGYTEARGLAVRFVNKTYPMAVSNNWIDISVAP